MDKCAHHWIIETPDGPTSTGICKLCSEERVFSTTNEASEWNDGLGKKLQSNKEEPTPVNVVEWTA